MTANTTATVAKAKLHVLLEQTEAGEEIEITKYGRRWHVLVPASGQSTLKGSLRGLAMTAEDEEDLFATDADRDAAT